MKFKVWFLFLFYALFINTVNTWAWEADYEYPTVISTKWQRDYYWFIVEISMFYYAIVEKLWLIFEFFEGEMTKEEDEKFGNLVDKYFN